MKKYIIIFCLLLVIDISHCQDVSEKVYRDNTLLEYPDLITTLFRENQVVFLGEHHRIRQHAAFVGEIIPVLQRQGIHILFSEFANYSDTKLADSILFAPAYSEKLVYRLLHRCEWDWAWQEYADIYKSAWRVNRKLKKGEPPFRIIGLQPDLNYAAIRAPGDWNNPDKIREYWNEENCKTWLEIIESEALVKNQKAMVHCGYHHAFSKFRHPIVVDGKFVRFEGDREGTAVYNKYPGKVATALLYNALPGKPALDKSFIRPFGGAIDAVIESLPGNKRRFGFVTDDSGLGSLCDTATYYSMGYGKLFLKYFCDAVVVTGEVCDFEPATFIGNFIDAGNYENTLLQSFPYSFTREQTVQSLNDSLVNWNRDNIQYVEKLKKNCK